MKRISLKEYHDFRKEWLNTKLCTEQRFGQAFLNTFFKKVTDPKLFNEANWEKASGIALVNYVKYFTDDEVNLPEIDFRMPRTKKPAKAKAKKGKK